MPSTRFDRLAKTLVLCGSLLAGAVAPASATAAHEGASAHHGYRKAPTSHFRVGLSESYRVSPKHSRQGRASTARSGSQTPVTPAPGSSDLLFSGQRMSDFWLRQAAPGAITEVPDPLGSGQSVFKFTVGDSDMLNITPNPRGELLSPSNISSGNEIWWSTKFMLPSDFPSSVPGWVNLMQGPYGTPFVGSPPWEIQVNGEHIQWTRNQTYGYDVPWQMPLVRGSWITVTAHERFAADGWMEMWINGQPVTFFAGDTYNPSKVAPTTHLAMATMDGSNNGGTNSLYLQQYRKKGMFPSLTTYTGGLQIGKTKAAVEG